MQQCHFISTDLEYYEGRAYGLHSVIQTAQARAVAVVRAYHPAYATASEDDIVSRFSIDDARQVLAAEHGCDGWDALRAHVGALASGRATAPWIDALTAVESGDTAALGAVLDAHPGLIDAPATNRNRLLTIATSEVRPDVVRFLLARGADPDLPNNKGWTALHAAAYGDPDRRGAGELVEIARVLLEAGASTSACAHGAGGTPLVQALFWGHTAQAELLAEHAIVPLNLRVAAGLGRLDLIDGLFDASGRPTLEAGLHREFHRPHSGFPPWRPTDDPQEVLDEGLVWACKSGRTATAEVLVGRGARVDAEPCNGTPLAWAARAGHTETIDWLLDHGAGLHHRTAFGGERELTPLHCACWAGSVPAARRLIERGADRTLTDPTHGGTPLGWAKHNGRAEVVAYLQSLQP